jgi:hypothetical protein
MMMLTQSYVVFALATVVMLVNFFGALFTIKRLRSASKPVRQKASSSSSRYTNVFDEVFVVYAEGVSAVWKIVKSTLQMFRGNRSHYD